MRDVNEQTLIFLSSRQLKPNFLWRYKISTGGDLIITICILYNKRGLNQTFCEHEKEKQDKLCTTDIHLLVAFKPASAKTQVGDPSSSPS